MSSQRSCGHAHGTAAAAWFTHCRGGPWSSNPHPAGAAGAKGNLFDRLIANEGATEAGALAHEAPVLLPPRTVFLMSDITRMRPLLPGACWVIGSRVYCVEIVCGRLEG